MTDLTPEHTSRRTEGDLHPEVREAYRYVDSVVTTADFERPLAWCGWALREAFLAGCTHARAALAEADEPAVPEGREPTRDELWDLWLQSVLLRQKVTDALADEPAVPEGREPVAVTGQPSDEELTQHLFEGFRGPIEFLCDAEEDAHLMIRSHVKFARAVLAHWGNPAPAPLADGDVADEPAVPEGREPASVTGQPSDEELESFLVDVASQHGDIYWAEPLVLARAVLARWGNPAPAPPADGEVAELDALLRAVAADLDFDDRGDDAGRCYRAAELLQRQALVPVAVSERLPGPEDCDGIDRVWCWSWALGTWRLSRINRSIHTHWLPAHALPEAE